VAHMGFSGLETLIFLQGNWLKTHISYCLSCDSSKCSVCGPHSKKFGHSCLRRYLLLASGHLSFPLHLAPGDAGELPGHRPRPVDGYRVLAAALDGWDYLDGRDALIARLLGHDLDLGPLGRRVHLGLRRARGSGWRRRVGRLGKRTDLFRPIMSLGRAGLVL